MDVDGSDSSDSDYDPQLDQDASDEEGDLGEKQLIGMSKTSRIRAQHLWDQMQAEDRKAVEEIMRRSVNYLANVANRTKEVHERNEIVLCEIFGKKVGKRLATYQITPEHELGEEEIKRRVQDSVQNVRKKRKITETRKFAGQEITVERTVHQSEKEGQDKKRKRESTGIDQVLNTIKGPKVVNTVAKSSMDWDNYKEKEGLEENLENAAKDGYLTKQDFLLQVDHNTFAVEKAQRAVARSKDAKK